MPTALTFHYQFISTTVCKLNKCSIALFLSYLYMLEKLFSPQNVITFRTMYLEGKEKRSSLNMYDVLSSKIIGKTFHTAADISLLYLTI